MAHDTDVLVVGAGPVGLVNAWGLMCLDPTLKIVVLEKYNKYQRTHTLVMQASQLEAIMRVTHTEQHPKLVQLLEQLKKDPHIRTNVLQEIFTDLAKEQGVTILTEEVKEETLAQKLADEFPHVSLIIGADGTHSVVSRTLYSEDNQVKHEFDYVLQLRYEVKGEEKSPEVKGSEWFDLMAHTGLVANEYVGHFAENKTPVTMQMMISRQEFIVLQQLSSKNPLKPFLDGQDQAQVQLPQRLQTFINQYLANKIEGLVAVGQQLDQESIRISVNEAPATHAKKVVNQHGDAKVILMGDAALGLSYFKGLNAGFEASARFLSMVEPYIQGRLKNQSACLAEYEHWFLTDFAPKKVKEVGNYSFWRIRSAEQAMAFAEALSKSSYIGIDEDLRESIRDYFAFCTLRQPLAEGEMSSWQPFPHREYGRVKFGQLSEVPVKHTLKKMGKIWVDYFKPYKSLMQLSQDYQQPLRGVGNLFIGLVKTLIGICTLNLHLVADGLMSMVRGIIELASTPLAWIIKPLTRGFMTLLHGGFKQVEENKGILDLAHYGQDYLAAKDDEALTENASLFEILAVCHDIHRKFSKSLALGQTTTLELEEHTRYSELRSVPANRKNLLRYFSLFASPQVQEAAASLRDEPVLCNSIA